ncbi:lipocalin family protein [Undibacterium squillarum]|uniref:Outer membrane lipoprotein Blc n=1 Tax=Undibacterium squillarum TaxID=1131567 RepID=A0ABQ2Y3W9_9BURK|nr:lipocalin family protein [Undibacterium squillarum]GGX50918.1 hypothetical protein GCM10010946_32130 [Undibacterium squillarum]
MKRISPLTTSALLAGMISVCLLSACQSNDDRGQPMQTVASVDLQRYQGTWHEVAMIPNRFQSQCVANTTARYTQRDGYIEVLNSCSTKEGKTDQATGKASVVEGSQNTKLKVSFFWPFSGNYWVLALDPDYRWAVVGEPSRQYGWVLARDKQLSEQDWQKVWAAITSAGYQTSQFRKTEQR